MFDDKDSLSEKRFKLTVFLLHELVKMREREERSGVLKKETIDGKSNWLLNDYLAKSQTLKPFDAKESVLIELLCKQNKEWGTKLDVLQGLFGKKMIDNIFTFNEYASFRGHFVPKAKWIRFKRLRCKWNSKKSQLEFKEFKNYTIFYSPLGRLVYVIESRGSRKYRNTEKTTFTYNDRNLPIIILTYKLESQILISSVKLFYDKEDRIIKEEVTNYHNSSEYDYTETVDYEHEYKENYHKITYYQEPKFSYLDENDEELEEEMVKYSIEEKFDSKGNLIEHKFYSEEEGLIALEKYFYSKDGDLVSSYYLNEDGNVLSESHYTESLTTTTDRKNSNAVTIDKTQVEYNNKGHWIKECTVSNDDLKWIEEREIKYYD